MAVSASGYIYIWSFRVCPGREQEFVKTYGPRGAWVDLFRQAPGHLRTELLQDQAEPGRYLTIDYWEDKASFQAFRQQYSREFAELDAQCEQLTESEELVGHFTIPRA